MGGSGAARRDTGGRTRAATPACAAALAVLLAAASGASAAGAPAAGSSTSGGATAPAATTAGGTAAASPDAGGRAGGLAVVLAVDTSGSMARSDPDGGRAAAVRAVAAGLRAGDWMGLVTFAASPVVVTPLEAMGTPAAQAAVDAAAAGIGASGYTDLLGALQTGAQVLAADPNASDRHVLILLTDGVPDLPSLAAPAAMSAYLQKMDSAAQAMGARGWVLDTVGLGPAVDAADLQDLAGLGHGRYVAARVSADLAADVLGLLPGSAAPPPAPAAAPAAGGPTGAAPAAPVPQPVPLALTPMPVRGTAVAGATVVLRLRAVNRGASAQRLGVSASGAVLPGRTGAHSILVPPGTTVLSIPVRPARAAGGLGSVELRVSAPTGVRLSSGDLRWAVPLRPWWRVWPRIHPATLAAVVLAAGAAVLLLGYAGYALRILPRLNPGGRLDVTGPNGDRLGLIRIPRRRNVTFGAADAPRGTVRLPWVPGEDRFFDLRAEVTTVRGGPWRAGLSAWLHVPAGIVYAEAVWPYHLYPGPMPRQRVDLYPDTSFGAAGLTFTFRSGGQAVEAGRVGVDVLAGVPGGEEEGGTPAPPLFPGGTG